MMMEMEYSFNSYEDNYNLPSWTSWMDNNYDSSFEDTTQCEPEQRVYASEPIAVEMLDLKILDDRGINYVKLDLLHCNLLTCSNCSIKFVLSACTYQPTTICTNCNRIMPITSTSTGCYDYEIEEEDRGLESINLNQLMLLYGNRYVNFRSTMCFVKLQVDYGNEELVVMMVTDSDFQIYSTCARLKLLCTIPIQSGTVKFIENLDADIYHIMTYHENRKLLLTQHYDVYLKLKQLLDSKLDLKGKMRLDTKFQKFNKSKELVKVSTKTKLNNKLKFSKRSSSNSSKSNEIKEQLVNQHLHPIQNFDLNLYIYSNHTLNLSLPNLSLQSNCSNIVPELSLTTSKSFSNGSDDELLTPRSPKSPALQLIPPIPTFSDNYFNLTKDKDLILTFNPDSADSQNSKIYLTKSLNPKSTTLKYGQEISQSNSKDSEKVEQFSKRLSIYNNRLVPPYPGAQLIGDQYSQIGWSPTQLKTKRSMNLKTSFDSFKKSLKSLPKFKDRGVRPNSLTVSNTNAQPSKGNKSKAKQLLSEAEQDFSKHHHQQILKDSLPKLSQDSTDTATEATNNSENEESDAQSEEMLGLDDLLNFFPLPPKRI